jgi:hypothetical protein
VVCDEAEILTDKKRESENAQKEAFEQWKKECGVILKPCPSCGAVIERTTGCSVCPLSISSESVPFEFSIKLFSPYVFAF